MSYSSLCSTYVLVKRSIAEMLVHEVSSGKKFLEVVVSDVDSDRHADGGPELDEHKHIVVKFV